MNPEATSHEFSLGVSRRKGKKTPGEEALARARGLAAVPLVRSWGASNDRSGYPLQLSLGFGNQKENHGSHVCLQQHQAQDEARHGHLRLGTASGRGHRPVLLNKGKNRARAIGTRTPLQDLVGQHAQLETAKANAEKSP